MKVLMKPIEMIAWFTKEGVPSPLRYKLQNDDESLTVKIDRIILREEEKFAGNRMYIFKCQSIINGTEKVYELKYELNTCKWYLYKI